MSAITEAVVFFRGGSIVKEMYLSEFEAVLDDVVGINDFADDEVQAVFLHINAHLKITAAVFFLISFDARGRVSRNWNIPLRHLMDYASLGPDLGAGPIKVACYSDCPEQWYQNQLWDPDMRDGNTLRLLSAAAERNRLGILSERRVAPGQQSAVSAPFFSGFANSAVPVAAPVVSSPGAARAGNRPEGPVFNRRYRQKRKALIARYRLAMATQAQELRKRREALENRQSEKLEERDARILALEAELDDLKTQGKHNALLLQRARKQIQEQSREMESLLTKGAGDHSAQIEELRQQYLKERDQRLAEQKFEYEGLIQKREEELYARATEIVGIRAQLSEIKKQNHELMLSSGDNVLDEMVKKGIVFVAYHPGIEHLLIARDEMPEYLADPVAFAAQRCEVSVAHYKEWLAHYRLPICRALDEGHYCGRPVDKVLRPRLFRAGEGDRCITHRRAAQE